MQPQDGSSWDVHNGWNIQSYYIENELYTLYHKIIDLSCLNLQHSKKGFYYHKIRISPEELLDEISRN